jgi:hypothetical protein
MSSFTSLDQVKKEFAEVVAAVNKEFGAGYAAKNPALVQHLMSAVQAKDQLQAVTDPEYKALHPKG